MPKSAIFRRPERSPNTPNPIAVKLVTPPQIGISAAHKLINPSAIENNARNLFVRSSGSNSV